MLTSTLTLLTNTLLHAHKIKELVRRDLHLQSAIVQNDSFLFNYASIPKSYSKQIEQIRFRSPQTPKWLLPKCFPTNLETLMLRLKIPFLNMHLKHAICLPEHISECERMAAKSQNMYRPGGTGTCFNIRKTVDARVYCPVMIRYISSFPSSQNVSKLYKELPK